MGAKLFSYLYSIFTQSISLVNIDSIHVCVRVSSCDVVFCANGWSSCKWAADLESSYGMVNQIKQNEWVLSEGCILYVRRLSTRIGPNTCMHACPLVKCQSQRINSVRRLKPHLQLFFDTCVCDQLRLRQDCAYAQSCPSLQYSCFI